MTRALDRQVGGDHYKGLKIQPIEYILANNLGFVEGNVVKYITRWQQKGGRADLEKVKHYVELLLEATAAYDSDKTIERPKSYAEAQGYDLNAKELDIPAFLKRQAT